MARKSRQEQQIAHITHGGAYRCLAVSEEMPKTKYQTAIYARLSVCDLDRDNSDTMESQIDALKTYVSQQSDMTLAGIYVDNGWSGTNFDRPDFQRMLGDVRAERINCIVVKDFSRLGRNYVETGHYLQDFFPLYHLRFISVNDHYDSLTSDPGSMAIAMKNIVDDYYSKDLSRKVSASLDVKRKEGIHNWGHPPYGYVRAPDNPAFWIIDTEVAPYVEMMFDWALDGMTYTGIARKLTELGAPTYQRLICTRRKGKTRKSGSDSWAASSVRFMLTNRAYTGDFVYNKSFSRIYDPGKHRDIPESEWIVVPNSHYAYVSHEDFGRINAMMDARKNKYLQSKESRAALRNAHPDKYQGLVYCGICQTRMRVRWDFGQSIYMAYSCPGKANQSHPGHEITTMNAKLLDEIVSQQIDLQIKLAVDVQSFLQRPSIRDETNRLRRQHRTIIQQLNNRLNQIREARSLAYEDLVDGVISAELYQQQIKRLTTEQNSINVEIQKEEKHLEYIDNCFNLENPWLQAFAKTGTMEEKDSMMIRQFIRRIDIYPDKTINIVFNYADFMLPLLSYIEECKGSQ